MPRLAAEWQSAMPGHSSEQWGAECPCPQQEKQEWVGGGLPQGGLAGSPPEDTGPAYPLGAVVRESIVNLRGHMGLGDTHR